MTSNQPPISKSFEEELLEILRSLGTELHNECDDSCTSKWRFEKGIEALTNLYAKHISGARKEGRIQMGKKIKEYSERADFFRPESKVVLAETMIWLSGLDETATIQDTTNTNVGDRDE